jgi:hypothetical protein
VRPHELIIHLLYDERGLFDDVAFRWDESLIYEGGVPLFGRIV